MQYVEVELDLQEVVVAESGSFMMMEEGSTMETILLTCRVNQRG